MAREFHRHLHYIMNQIRERLISARQGRFCSVNGAGLSCLADVVLFSSLQCV